MFEQHAMGMSHGEVDRHRPSFRDLTAELSEQSNAFSSDHVHQGCLGNCYFCAALSLLAKFGRQSLHECIKTTEDEATGQRCASHPTSAHCGMGFHVLSAHVGPLQRQGYRC